MLLYKSLSGDSFTMADRDIMLDGSLSMGSRILYYQYASYKEGTDYSDRYTAEKMQASYSCVMRWKKELVERNLVYVEKIGSRQYRMFLGRLGKTGQDVREERIKRQEIKRKCGKKKDQYLQNTEKE